LRIVLQFASPGHHAEVFGDERQVAGSERGAHGLEER
jgi:hypothetical protein